MGATLTQTLVSAPISLRRTDIRRSATRPWSREGIAWCAVLVALLIAMLPGLASVPVTTGPPRSLTAPVVTTATDAVTVIADPTPEPRPQPAGG